MNTNIDEYKYLYTKLARDVNRFAPGKLSINPDSTSAIASTPFIATFVAGVVSLGLSGWWYYSVSRNN